MKAFEMILGHLPMVGVSYRSHRDCDDLVRAFSEKTATSQLLKQANRLGITRFTCEPPLSVLTRSHVEVLAQLCDNYSSTEAIPCIGVPLKLGTELLDPFQRWATVVHFYTQKKATSYLPRFLADPVLQCRPGWAERLPQVVSEEKHLSKKEIENLRVAPQDVGALLQSLDCLRIRIVEFGSEIDLIALCERWDILGSLVDCAREHGFECGVGTHHAGFVLPMLTQFLPEIKLAMVPINALGVMMFPDRETVLKAVSEVPFQVIAIKPLAGGHGNPAECFEYLRGIPDVDVVVGVRDLQELEFAACHLGISRNR